MDQIFETGDVVRLKSGGPNMTVVKYEPKDGVEVTCQWFNTDKLIEKSFHQDTLMKYSSPSIFTTGTSRDRYRF